MNIYLFEIKNLWKSCVSWLISLILVLVLFMNAVYPVFQGGKEEFLELFNNFPPEFLKAFGFDISNFFGFETFYSFSFTYVGLLAAIMAIFVSVSIFSREKRGKCMDFILTKPIERGNIYLYKLAACLTIIGVTNVILATYTTILFFINIPDYVFTAKTLQLVLAPFFTQLLFVTLGMLVSILFKRIRSVSGIATTFGMIAFLISAVINILEKEYLLFLAPLKYFEPACVISDGSYDVKLVVVAVFIMIISIGISYKKYCDDDVAVV